MKRRQLHARRAGSAVERGAPPTWAHRAARGPTIVAGTPAAAPTIADGAPGPTLPDRGARKRLLVAGIAVTALVAGVAIGVAIAFGGC